MSDTMAVVEAYVVAVGGVPPSALRSPSRVETVVRWRSVAVYLAHTVFGEDLTTAGGWFHRDRTTAGHMVRRVEEGREGLGDDLLEHLDVGVREFRRALELVGRMAPLKATG